MASKIKSVKAEKLKKVELNKKGGYLLNGEVEHKPIPPNQKFFLTMHEEINSFYKNKLEYLLPPMWYVVVQLILAIGLSGFMYVIFLILAISGLFKTFGVVSLLPVVVIALLIFTVAKYGMKGAIWLAIWNRQSSLRQYLDYMVNYDLDFTLVFGVRDLISAAPSIIVVLLYIIFKLPFVVFIVLLAISLFIALVVQAATFFIMCPIVVEKKKSIDVFKNIGELLIPFNKTMKETIYCMILTAVGYGLLVVPILGVVSWFFILPILYNLRCRIYLTSKKARGL